MKHKRKDRPIEKRINLPTSVVTRVDEQLNDPLTSRPPHGAWAHLVTSLLTQWLDGNVKVSTPIRKPRKLDEFL